MATAPKPRAPWWRLGGEDVINRLKELDRLAAVGFAKVWRLFHRPGGPVPPLDLRPTHSDAMDLRAYILAAETLTPHRAKARALRATKRRPSVAWDIEAEWDELPTKGKQ
jgi:hypothetical protein